MLVVYGVLGGFSAAVVTDFVQGCLTIVFSFLLLPFAIYRLGGFDGLHAGVARTVSGSADHLWTLVAPGRSVLLHPHACDQRPGRYAPQPHVMPINNAVALSGKPRWGSLRGFMKRVCTIAWTMLGMCAIAMYPGMKAGEFDQVFGRMARELLPQVLPG